MKLQEQLNGEIKIGKIVSDDDGLFYIEEYDKDGNKIEDYPANELLEKFLNKEYIKIKIDFIAEK